LYWTVAQLVAHHSSGGCNLRAGDLFGTGTISAPGDGGLGSLLAISAGGRRPVELASRETRPFLEDGDSGITAGALRPRRLCNHRLGRVPRNDRGRHLTPWRPWRLDSP